MKGCGKIWDFIQNQILGMQWLYDLLAQILNVFSVDVQTKLGSSFHFFLYDVIKISVLLCTLIWFVSYIQSYFPPERSKKFWENIKVLVLTSYLHYWVR